MIRDADRRRARMVEEQLRRRAIRDERLLHACLRVPRHQFVPESLQAEAYDDRPLPIGEGQTISQPYMMALMVEALRLCGTEQVLEIGTGSGYQTAILSMLALEIYSIERIPSLAHAAHERLQALGLLNVYVQTGDGTEGWWEHAPYDAILVAAATHRVPPALAEQLAEGGRLVIPLGPPEAQTLTLCVKTQGALRATPLCGCVFVPLVSSGG